jgi:hypothetical protein
MIAHIIYYLLIGVFFSLMEGEDDYGLGYTFTPLKKAFAFVLRMLFWLPLIIIRAFY